MRPRPTIHSREREHLSARTKVLFRPPARWKPAFPGGFAESLVPLYG